MGEKLDMGSSEETPLLINAETGKPEEAERAVTAWRWYMLFVLCGIGFMQGCVWNTWGPIAPSVEPFFHWHDTTVALMGNWVCLSVSGWRILPDGIGAWSSHWPVCLRRGPFVILLLWRQHHGSWIQRVCSGLVGLPQASSLWDAVPGPSRHNRRLRRD